MSLHLKGLDGWGDILPVDQDVPLLPHPFMSALWSFSDVAWRPPAERGEGRGEGGREEGSGEGGKGGGREGGGREGREGGKIENEREDSRDESKKLISCWSCVLSPPTSSPCSQDFSVDHTLCDLCHTHQCPRLSNAVKDLLLLSFLFVQLCDTMS